MAVLRKEKKENFTMIDNAIFKDYTLSMKAKGLLCQMLSLPDNWDYSIAGLTQLVSDGESAVRSTLKELEEAGYFRRERIKENGKIVRIEYVVSENKNCDFPRVENPQVEIPQVGNQGQLITKELITDKSITKESINNQFEILWELYPRKQGKKQAETSYRKSLKEGASFEEVKQGIEAYVNYINAKGIEEKYIKMGSTFFSQRSWQDDWSVKGYEDTRIGAESRGTTDKDFGDFSDFGKIEW